jgi:hypothetical protein
MPNGLTTNEAKERVMPFHEAVSTCIHQEAVIIEV